MSKRRKQTGVSVNRATYDRLAAAAVLRAKSIPEIVEDALAPVIGYDEIRTQRYPGRLGRRVRTPEL